MSLDEEIRVAQRNKDHTLEVRLRFRIPSQSFWCALCHHPFGYEGLCQNEDASIYPFSRPCGCDHLWTRTPLGTSYIDSYHERLKYEGINGIDIVIASALHYGSTIYHATAVRSDGYRLRARISGKLKRWKRSPNRFRIPFRVGMFGFGAITELNGKDFRTTQDLK
jgi:hypothetical protein